MNGIYHSVISLHLIDVSSMDDMMDLVNNIPLNHHCQNDGKFDYESFPKIVIVESVSNMI